MILVGHGSRTAPLFMSRYQVLRFGTSLWLVQSSGTAVNPHASATLFNGEIDIRFRHYTSQ
jgi:hypothetical protein